VFVCSVVIQIAKRMDRIILIFLDSLAIPHFSTLSNKRHNFREKKEFEHETFFLFFFEV